MSLHLLPHCKIANAFADLRTLASDRQHVPDGQHRKLLRKVFEYVEETWIESRLWPPTASSRIKLVPKRSFQCLIRRTHIHFKRDFLFECLNVYRRKIGVSVPNRLATFESYKMLGANGMEAAVLWATVG